MGTDDEIVGQRLEIDGTQRAFTGRLNQNSRNTALYCRTVTTSRRNITRSHRAETLDHRNTNRSHRNKLSSLCTADVNRRNTVLNHRADIAESPDHDVESSCGHEQSSEHRTESACDSPKP